jgi:hypothetical protein
MKSQTEPKVIAKGNSLNNLTGKEWIFDVIRGIFVVRENFEIYIDLYI